MKKITKLISLFCLATVFVFASCSSSTSGGGVTYIGSKAPTEPKEVGDIVFNDGSATYYADFFGPDGKISGGDDTITAAQKKAAIAIIFYVGKELNDEEDGTRNRTLGVGLEPGSLKQWCSNWGNGIKVNKKIESILCYPKGYNYKDYDFNDESYKEVNPNRNGKNNFSKVAEYLVSNDEEDDTGNPNNYSAFWYCKNYSTKATKSTKYDKNGWYLPTFAELIYVCREYNDKIHYATQVLDSYSYVGQDFWTSSVSCENDNEAWYISFTVRGELKITDSTASMTEQHEVLPIREF